MTASKQKQLSNSAISALGWPLLLGAAACSGLYILILQGPLNSPFMVRYFTSHPVLYFESGMFFVGLAALLMKTLELLRQSNAFRRIRLDDTDADADVRSVCSDLLLQLDAVPAPLQRTYLVERLSRAVAYIDRKGATDGLDDELKYLADLDGARQQESYALVRILAWAIPMLGFLGTVVGITQALGGMDYKLFATDISAAMQGLLAGLYVAFDTTALALVLSMTLMFVMFFADRVETNMLNEVDERVHGDVVLRFPDGGGRDQGYVRAVERMSSAVVKTMETLLRQQTDQWKTAIEQTNEQLGAVAQATGEQIRIALGDSLDTSLKNHAERLARFEQDADHQMRARWDQWQTALTENIRVVREQQAEVARQSQVLERIVTATGDIANLENSLNRNLQSLATTRHFEDAVLSLSAAIQLLSARTTPRSDTPTVELRATTEGRAA